MQKLPVKYNFIAMPFVLSVMMSFIISGVSTLRALGFIAGAGLCVGITAI